jgi:hypothetical protein
LHPEFAEILNPTLASHHVRSDIHSLTLRFLYNSDFPRVKMWCLEEEIAGRRLGRSAPNDCGRLGNEEAALSVAPRGSIYALEVLEVFALEHRRKDENLEKVRGEEQGFPGRTESF